MDDHDEEWRERGSSINVAKEGRKEEMKSELVAALFPRARPLPGTSSVKILEAAVPLPGPHCSSHKTPLAVLPQESIDYSHGKGIQRSSGSFAWPFFVILVGGKMGEGRRHSHGRGG